MKFQFLALFDRKELIGYVVRSLVPLRLGWIVCGLLCITSLIIPCLMSQWIIQITQGNMNLINVYLGFQILEPILNTMIVSNLKLGLANIVKKKFIHDAMNRYNSMTYLSKNKISIDQFNQNMGQAQWSVYLAVDWGLPTIMYLTGSCVSAIITFYEKNLIKELIIISSLIFCFHNYVIGSKQKRFTEINKLARKIRNHVSAKIQLFLVPFQYKELSPDDICRMHDQAIQQDYNMMSMWNHIMGLTSCGNKTVGALLTFIAVNSANISANTGTNNTMNHEIIATFMLMTKVISQLNASVSDATQFMNQWAKHKDDWNTFQDSLKYAEYSEDCEKLSVPDNLEIKNINVKKGTFTLIGGASISGLDIGKGKKILITGKTNGGKTTLMDGLTGKIRGIEFNSGQGMPENYYHSIADMFQTIREKFPSSKVSIRNFFKDEKNVQLIRQCLRIAFCTDNSYNDFMKPFTDQKDPDTSMNLHPYDVELSEALSGGQKTRLCIATRVYEMIKYDKQILILDEPEQGLDSETKIKVINNLFKEFADKTIFMVSHLCECERQLLNIQWDAHLHVIDGIVYKQ